MLWRKKPKEVIEVPKEVPIQVIQVPPIIIIRNEPVHSGHDPIGYALAIVHDLVHQDMKGGESVAKVKKKWKTIINDFCSASDTELTAIGSQNVFYIDSRRE